MILTFQGFKEVAQLMDAKFARLDNYSGYLLEK